METFNKGDVVAYGPNVRDGRLTIGDIGIVTLVVNQNECLVKFNEGEDLFDKTLLMVVVRAPKS